MSNPKVLDKIAKVTDLKDLKRQIRAGELPNMVAVAANFYHIVGGPYAFAKFLYDEMNESRPGGMARARILDLLMSCLRFVTPKDVNLEDKYRGLSDEDLDREIENALSGLNPKEPPVPPQPPPLAPEIMILKDEIARLTRENEVFRQRFEHGVLPETPPPVVEYTEKEAPQ